MALLLFYWSWMAVSQHSSALVVLVLHSLIVKTPSSSNLSTLVFSSPQLPPTPFYSVFSSFSSFHQIFSLPPCSLLHWWRMRCFADQLHCYGIKLVHHWINRSRGSSSLVSSGWAESSDWLCYTQENEMKIMWFEDATLPSVGPAAPPPTNSPDGSATAEETYLLIYELNEHTWRAVKTLKKLSVLPYCFF